MQKYVFSGNEEWLKRIKEQYKDQVIVSSDYEKLLSLQKDENTLIFTLHDHKRPINPKGHKTPYLFNEFHNVDPGAMYSDVFLEESEEKIFEFLQAKMQKYDLMLDTLNKVKEGSLQLHYDGWFFSGGRGEDSDMYVILDHDGEIYADLSMNEDHSISMRFMQISDLAVGDTGCVEFYTAGWYERINETLYDRWDQIIVPCLKRDDPEICEKLIDKDGQFCLPRDYCDIDREDILNGDYPLAEEIER